MDLEIRTIEPAEADAYNHALGSAFSEVMAPDEAELNRSVAEFDRHHVALEAGVMVGGAAAGTMQMTVPGGASVQTAAVTAVGVVPTHRRRGVNTALMRAQLDDVRSRGECLAALFASEGGIYGRFGYGLASFKCRIDALTERASFVPQYRASGRVRLLPREDALPLMRRVYDRAAPMRPGMMILDDAWFAWRFAELEEDRETPAFYAVHESDAGEPDAYAAYRVKHRWPDEIPGSELRIRELMATTPGGEADMWRFVFGVDLIHRVRADDRPIDDLLLRLVMEPRRLRFTVGDGLWLRIVDVPQALGCRSYGGSGRLVIGVHDPFCPWNDGTFAVEASEGSATCDPSGEEPDLVCTASELGAVYLGGSTFRQLWRAGRIEAHTADALQRADAIFASDPAPWCTLPF